MRLKTNSLATLLAALLVAPVTAFRAGAADGRHPSAPSDTLQLAALLREAMERNPEIQAARRAIDAKRARISQARAWPDPGCRSAIPATSCLLLP